MSVTPSLRLGPTHASLSTRRLPVEVSPIGTIDDTFVLKVPPGLRVLTTPTDVHADGPFGAYSVKSELLPGKVVVRSRVTIRASTIPPDRYAAWRLFCAEVDAAFTPRLVMGPT
jgi:hypothetical protein